MRSMLPCAAFVLTVRSVHEVRLSLSELSGMRAREPLVMAGL